MSFVYPEHYPLADTTINTPRDVVTRTLESYDYHVQVASLKLQKERRVPARQGRGTCHPPAPSSHRPDIQAYTAVRDAHEDVHRQVVFGDVPGVEIGDRYKFRHRMAVVGLHHLPNCGIAFGSPPPYNISLASAVVYVPKGGYADNVDNGHEVIYTGIFLILNALVRHINPTHVFHPKSLHVQSRKTLMHVFLRILNLEHLVLQFNSHMLILYMWSSFGCSPLLPFKCQFKLSATTLFTTWFKLVLHDYY